MPYLNEQLKLPLYSNSCYVSTGNFEPIIQRYETGALKRPCSGNGVNIVDCHHPELESFINEVGGLNFSTAQYSEQDIAGLPRFIPIINASFFKDNNNGVQANTFGISLKDFLGVTFKKRNGILQVSRLNIQENILEQPFLQGKEIILFSSGHDVLIEKLWQKSEVIDYFKKLGRIKFKFVTAINFSLFFGECPVAHAINLKKSQMSYELVEKLGGKGIPHVYWLNKNHLDRWSEWLNTSPGIKIITINCQCCGKEHHEFIRSGIRYLAGKTNGDVHFLLEGPSRQFLSPLSDLADLIHIASKTPAYYAMNYARNIYNGYTLSKSQVINGDRLEILKVNIRDYFKYLDEQFFNRVDKIVIDSMSIKKNLEIVHQNDI